jgi:hypothetical protein
MRKTTLIAVLLLSPLFAFAGIGGSGYRDCSTHSSEIEIFELTLKDTAESLNLNPEELFSADSHFNSALTEKEKTTYVLGNGEYGSFKTTLKIEQRCKSANGGMKMTLSVPRSFQDKIVSKINGVLEKEIVDTQINQNVNDEKIELDGGLIKVTIDLRNASKTELMRKGRFSKNIRLSILNKNTGVMLEGINHL